MSVVWDSNLLSAGISPELSKKIPAVIEECKSQGLDPFDLAIEEYTADEIAEIAAFGGFPVRFPHFSFGQSYETLYHQYHSGQGKIYEMVINNDPTYMYLQRNNPIVDNLTVVAHALAHSDFFKNNIMFKHTDRNMMNVMANHGQRIRRYMDLYGTKKVSRFLDACLSVDDLIDPSLVWRSSVYKNPRKVDFDDRPPVEHVGRIDAKEYMDRYVNTDEYISKQRKQRDTKKKLKEDRFPPKPERDVLLFLLKYTRLETWQQNILSMIRDEAIYFRPQIVTKVMNEGWASYWDSRIMTTGGFAGDEGIIQYAKHHSGVLGGKYNMSNPYRLGVCLFNDIKKRWDKGQFGREWENCEDYNKKRDWDTKANLGDEKIFEVREHYNDLTFLNEFFTKEFCHEYKFFEYKLNRDTNKYEIISKDYKKIKQKLMSRYINGGRPIISLENLRYNDNEIMLDHDFDGRPLESSYVKGTLKMLNYITKRPVNIRTVRVSVKTDTKYAASGWAALMQGTTETVESESVIYRYSGKQFSVINGKGDMLSLPSYKPYNIT